MSQRHRCCVTEVLSLCVYKLVVINLWDVFLLGIQTAISPTEITPQLLYISSHIALGLYHNKAN